jgi:hypothetical protein
MIAHVKAASRSCRRTLLAFALVAVAPSCASEELAPSIWPPSDFVCVVEEMALRDGAVHVGRRFHVDAQGVVVRA